MNEALLTITQAFQLMGLVQCALLLAYLAGCGGDAPRRLLACAFFLVLAASFGPPLWPEEFGRTALGGLAAIGSAVPAFSYLLASQVLESRFPQKRQFAILFLPLLGAPLVYAGKVAPLAQVCLGELCLDAGSTAQVWRVMAGGLILLSIMALAELLLKDVKTRHQWQERRGLALGLVIVNAAGLGAVLADLFHVLEPDEAEFAEIALGLGFIYLATTMMFRIFPESVEFARNRAEDAAPASSPPSESPLPSPLDEEDQALLARIRRFLAEEQPHLKENFHREDMARALDVPEHRLSKVVNQGFGKSLIDVLNEQRVEEAKRLLASSDQQITQIAFAAGFNALPSFHRVFKKHAGCSPSEWRDKNRGIGEILSLKS
ncbi:MAG: helix-turn-helix transcriptional regulator [Alphaproteobacteria bacterium]|nr:helix-turn-helix transcriptional regulator [Alphaproteobacteria bacterium]